MKTRSHSCAKTDGRDINVSNKLEKISKKLHFSTARRKGTKIPNDISPQRLAHEIGRVSKGYTFFADALLLHSYILF